MLSSYQARVIGLLRPLKDVTVTAGESATFDCELSYEGIPVEWFLQGKKLEPSDKVRRLTFIFPHICASFLSFTFLLHIISHLLSASKITKSQEYNSATVLNGKNGKSSLNQTCLFCFFFLEKLENLEYCKFLLYKGKLWLKCLILWETELQRYWKIIIFFSQINCNNSEGGLKGAIRKCFFSPECWVAVQFCI